MLVSKEDTEKLERVGFDQEDFTITDRDGLTKLRNVGEWCYFYDPEEKKCRVYEYKPLGCYLYPVVYAVDEGVVIDELCPRGETISEDELRRKGNVLIKLLKRLQDN